MKRRKSRIILGTTAVAAALTFGGCSGSQNTSPAESNTAVTAQENTAETADTAKTAAETADTAKTAGEEADTDVTAAAADTSETAAEDETAVEAATGEYAPPETYEIEVFDVNENYNSVVYGPPAED